MKKAPILARFVALLIDTGILLAFSAMTLIAALSGYRLGSGGLTFVDLSCILFISSILSCIIFLLYFTCLTMREGMTAGKRIMGIKVVKRDGASLGFLRAFLRTVAYMLSAMVCYIGFFMALFFRGRTLHDMIAGTEVIRCEPAGASDGSPHDGETGEEAFVNLQGGTMNQDGKVGCGCLIFILICILVGVGLTAHPISLRLLGNQFRYEDKAFPSDAIFVPRFEEDRSGEAYIEAFREYWAGNGKVIYVEEEKMFGASILDPVHKMARGRGIKEASIRKIEADGEEPRKAYKIKAQFAAMGIKKVIVLVPEYASRRFHMLYSDSGQDGKTVYLIRPVNVSYFKKDGWWKNGQSRLLLLNELFSMGSLGIEKFKHGDGKD